MSNILAIARREVNSFFYSPIAYVVMAILAEIAGVYFLFSVFRTGEAATMRPLFSFLTWVLIAICPAISMKLVAEELRSGTVETLMTSPVSDAQVIVGKWLGALGFFAVALLPTLFFVGLLAVFADPDYGPIISGYVGLLLIGALYLAIGAFASVTTRNQIIAFLLTAFIILMITVVVYWLQFAVPTRFVFFVNYLDATQHYEDFAKGLLDFSHFVYFASGVALFLVLAVKLLETRKWR
jgi:ABC-2 type transport system permease protein